MRAFGYAGGASGEPLRAAGASVFHDMSDLPRLLAEQEKG
jgi:hypothetical protein